jgi:hypothetical protein
MGLVIFDMICVLAAWKGKLRLCEEALGFSFRNFFVYANSRRFFREEDGWRCMLVSCTGIVFLRSLQKGEAKRKRLECSGLWAMR